MPEENTSPASHPVPRIWREELSAVLLTQAQINTRVRQLGAVITQDFQGREMTLVALLNGCVVFLADLIRRLPLPLRLDFMGVSSYRDNVKPGKTRPTKRLQMDVRGRDVLLIDDILDTGGTLEKAVATLAALKAASVKTCVLLDKPSRRTRPVRADYVGFSVPDVFVVGYGLDFAERFRNLPFIGVLHRPHPGAK